MRKRKHLFIYKMPLTWYTSSVVACLCFWAAKADLIHSVGIRVSSRSKIRMAECRGFLWPLQVILWVKELASELSESPSEDETEKVGKTVSSSALPELLKSCEVSSSVKSQAITWSSMGPANFVECEDPIMVCVLQSPSAFWFAWGTQPSNGVAR